ncbi:mmc protein [Colletotrichum truncatum]|uniref:Mmc protein n=1 Tax=Colletotrichum truncatum TaxID=5467 RepID=A0ACC3ZEE1_COLTU|nr:mmc protein [Colletotrichum truncatum]KAF6801384.1 mmc protein [Colletotrichum truncatum]
MKFSAAALVLAAGAMASKNVTYVTEVVSSYTTYCPGPTVITHADKTYTITKATTLTITDCPCTVTKPVITSSVVKCDSCSVPTKNATIPVVTPSISKTATGGLTPTKPISVPTAGAGKAAALSGAGLAGVLGLAAFVL